MPHAGRSCIANAHAPSLAVDGDEGVAGVEWGDEASYVPAPCTHGTATNPSNSSSGFGESRQGPIDTSEPERLNLARDAEFMATLWTRLRKPPKTRTDDDLNLLATGLCDLDPHLFGTSQNTEFCTVSPKPQTIYLKS